MALLNIMTDARDKHFIQSGLWWDIGKGEIVWLGKH